MRLLQTSTLQLEEFFANSAVDRRLGNPGIPKYAILSHTWGCEEITFQDITGNRTVAQHKTGFNKVRDCCRQARGDGYAYIWIDTCCIDKTSSAELSEAINSMYQWYKDAEICYAYLSDVIIHSESPNLFHNPRQPFYTEEGGSSPSYSRWFSRGWTLQELLAPAKLQFFDSNWNSIGMKQDHIDAISGITSIDLFALNGGDLRRLSIARRMSWAANRQTKRIEDMAYCLLGVFSINMPLLYGEGAKAFIRLQEEILKISNDQSLFAWKYPHVKFYRGKYPEEYKIQGLLAPTPELFQYSDAISQFYSETSGHAPIVSTNKGIQVELLMCRVTGHPSGLVYLAMLNCPVGHVPGRLPAICLGRLSTTSEQYTRVNMSRSFIFGSLDPAGRIGLEGFDVTQPQRNLVEIHSKTVHSDWTVKTIFIKQDTQSALPPGFWLVIPENLSEFNMVVTQAHPRDLWDPKTRVLQSQDEPRLGLRESVIRKLGAFLIKWESYDSSVEKVRVIYCVLIFGIAYCGWVPWCHLSPARGYYEERHEQMNVGPRDQADYLRHPPIDTYLQREFDNFRVHTSSVLEETDGTRRHVHICDTLKLVTVAESSSVSGRQVNLLRLLTISEYQQEMSI